MAELSGARTSYNNTDGRIRQLYEELSYYTGISPDRIFIDTSGIQNNLADKRPGGVNMSLPGTAADSNQLPNPLIDYYLKQRSLYLQTENLVKKSYLPKIMLTGITWAPGFEHRLPGKIRIGAGWLGIPAVQLPGRFDANL